MKRPHQDLRLAKRVYWTALVVFFVAALCCAVEARQRRVLEATRDELVKARSGLTLVREAGKVRREALEQYSAYLADGNGASADRLLYQRLDLIKARLHPEDFTISTIERKGDEVSLQYSLKFLNPGIDDFLNAVSYLEGSGFPVTIVNAASVNAGTEGKEGLTCIVNGRVLAFQRKP